jgi:hypothetical protein
MGRLSEPAWPSLELATDLEPAWRAGPTCFVAFSEVARLPDHETGLLHVLD